jgi:GH25 family lysozyme M1 (1,4-beta-N-acetylmuramidase)
MKRLAGFLLLAILLTGCAATEEVPPTTEPQGWVMPESLYQPEDFVLVGDFLQCTKGGTVVGIDVSSHQGQIDWQTVAASGVRFVFVRLGYRGYGDGSLNEDTCAKANLAGAKAAGLKLGAYFFSQAVDATEALEEAAYAMEILDGISLDLPLVFDWEYISETARTGEVGRGALTEATAAFCEAVEQAGYRPMVYFNTNQGRFRLKLQDLEEYPWWLAKYSMEAQFLCKVDLWQYTDQGSVPGINGNVDIDLMFTDYGLGKEIFGE